MNNTTITLNMNNLTEQERQQLLKLVEKGNGNKVWKPKRGERYFTVFGEGNVFENTWTDRNEDATRYSIGNCFKTIEEAELALEKTKALAELRRYAEVYNEEEIDWNNKRQLKYCIVFDHVKNNFNFSDCSYWEYLNMVYFTSEEIAQNAIDEIGEDRIKKYLFGVED